MEKTKVLIDRFTDFVSKSYYLQNVRRYIDILIIIITFPYSTYINSFLTAASLLVSSLFIISMYNYNNYRYVLPLFFSREELNVKWRQRGNPQRNISLKFKGQVRNNNKLFKFRPLRNTACSSLRILSYKAKLYFLHSGKNVQA